MYCNENRQNALREKSKKSFVKKSSTHISQSVAEHSKPKNKKSSRHQNNRKHYRYKHTAVAASDYVGAERLTKHVGIFNKGKISESISRFEKRMPKEARARANQDLQQVLRLSSSDRHKRRKRHRAKRKIPSCDQSLPRSVSTSEYSPHNSEFASTSWQDKLQKSVGLASVKNSILASVHEQTRKKSPIHSELLIARKTLLTKIHPCIKEANSAIFPNVSNKDKIRNKLLQIKAQLKPPTVILSEQTSVCSSVFSSPQISQDDKKAKHSSQSVVDDFELNPIFTGEPIDHSDITEIFPPVKKFVEYTDSSNDFDSFPGDSGAGFESGIQTSQAPSSSIGIEPSLVTLVPSSPTSSENSPSWKLKLSPDKFVPEPVPSPTIYFRHKMF